MTKEQKKQPADDAEYDIVLIGMELKDAEKAVAAEGLTLREAVIDGEPQFLDVQHDAKRINVATSGGKIVGVCSRG